MMTPPDPAPGERELLQGEKNLGLALASLEQAVDTHRDSFFQALDESVTRPLREAFLRAYEAHCLLLDEAGLGDAKDGEGATSGETGNGGSSAPTPGGQGLRRYREGIRPKVLEPLRDALRGIEIGREVADRWTGFLNGLPLLADPLPLEVVRLEPEDLYGPRGADTRFNALRKTVVRGRRTLGKGVSSLGMGILRLFGVQGKPPEPRAQRVPLRRLTKDCMLGRCPLRLREVGEALQQGFAVPVSRLESAVASWSMGWYQAEEGARLAEGHVGARFLDGFLREPPSDVDPGPAASVSEETRHPEIQPDPGGSLRDRSELMGICRELSDALAMGAALGPPSELERRVREAMREEWEVLLEEIRIAGSFQRSGSTARDRARVQRGAEQGIARAKSWTAWHEDVQERLQLGSLLLRLHLSFAQAEDQMMGRIVETALSPMLASWVRARDGLQDLRVEGEAIFSEAGGPEKAGDLGVQVEELQARAQDLLVRELIQIPASVQPISSIHQVADEVAGRLADGFRFLPETVQIPLPQETRDRVDPTEGTRQLPFREFVQKTVDVLRLESIRNAPEPLLVFFQKAVDETGEIPNIASFNLAAARDELREPPEGPLEAVIEDARSLTLDGLSRTSAALEGLLTGLAEAWTEFTGNAHALLHESYREIHLRVVAEGVVQEQILGLRAELKSRVRMGVERVRAAGRQANRRSGRLLRRAKIRIARLIRLGRAAVGTAQTQEGEAGRALEILRGIPRLLEALPLVYRRLFSFQPVTDPNLLVGRDLQTEWVARRLETWKVGFGLPCVLSSSVGAGQTSFLNALAETHLQDFDVCRIELTERVGTPEAMATLIAEALDLVEGEEAWTLDNLSERLRSSPTRGRPLAILVEQLEQLLLRTPGGTDLLGRYFSFQAKTTPTVFWLSTVSGAAWKFFEKSEPTSAALVARFQMTVLSAKDMEELIMSRHRRSGLPLEFVPPSDLNPLLRRKIRLTRNETAKQVIIRREYFERIYRMSEGSIAMAILFWLRSADFTSREGRLLVQPPRPIRFAFLDTLDLSLDFALKAFLEHGSLTSKEYGKVFHASEREAFQVFEALRNRKLLEPVGTGAGDPSREDAVREGERYRIPRILSQAVAARLKNRNILH